ncbi:MAG TPA: SRPBCC domain-containing protein, partial [Bacteroidia bacterium]|nr:SRPBCC domain-containing protein [Bacteroidia bacterium]
MKNIKKYYTIPVPPTQLYQALTNQFTIELWTGGDAVMQAVADTEFSLWDGSIVGRNLQFETDKLIKQQWYFGDEETPSIVTIKLHADKKGTSVEL